MVWEGFVKAESAFWPGGGGGDRQDERAAAHGGCAGHDHVLPHSRVCPAAHEPQRERSPGRFWACGEGLGLIPIPGSSLALTLLPKNCSGRAQKESWTRKRRDRSTSWNSCRAVSTCSWVEESGGMPGCAGIVTFTPAVARRGGMRAAARVSLRHAP